MNRGFLALAAGTALAGCTTDGGSVHAELRGANGQVIAEATARQSEGAVRVEIVANELEPGSYGTHVHAIGRCDPPGFDSAGPHWNPTGRQHGSQNPQGAHLGDLPNLDVGEDGRGRIEFAIDGATLRGDNGLVDGDGAAVVIHAAPDDYRTDPSGNSGARIACGVLR